MCLVGQKVLSVRLVDVVICTIFLIIYFFSNSRNNTYFCFSSEIIPVWEGFSERDLSGHASPTCADLRVRICAKQAGHLSEKASPIGPVKIGFPDRMPPG
jgi:hypothetical protein